MAADRATTPLPVGRERPDVGLDRAIRRWLIAHAITQRRWFLLGGTALLATNALALTVPWILKEAVEAIRSGAPPHPLRVYAGAMAAVALVAALARIGSRHWIYRAGREAEHAMRVEVVAHLLGLPLAYFRSGRLGDILSRAINDVSDVRMMMGPGYLQVLNTILLYGGAAVPMFLLSGPLLVLAMAPFPILGIVFNRMHRQIHARSLAVQEQMGVLSARVQESIAAALVVKCFATQEIEAAAIDTLSRDYRDRNLRLALMRSLIFPTVALVAAMGMVLLVGVGGRMVENGRLPLGALVAFLSYYGMLLWPTIGLGWIVNVIGRGQSAARRLGEAMSIPCEPGQAADPIWIAPGAILAERDTPVPADAAPPDAGGAMRQTQGADGLPALEVRDLTFTYTDPRTGEPAGARPRVLEGVSIRVPEGTLVGIAGRMGSGKSTLLAILARLYEPPAGTVFAGGADVTSLPLGPYRRGISLVPQESFHFSVTLRENILYAGEGDEATARHAATLAGLDPDLAALPSGLNTEVGERGITLSGGQRQRLALARAIAIDPPVLLLDDTLSAVDAQTEAAILAQMARLRRSVAGGPRRTTVVVASRPQSLRAADWIYCLDNGRVVESGPPAQLLGQRGTLAQLLEEHEAAQALA